MEHSQAAGVAADSHLYGALLHAHGRAGDPAAAVAAWRRMAREGVPRTEVCARGLIDACGRCVRRAAGFGSFYAFGGGGREHDNGIEA